MVGGLEMDLLELQFVYLLFRPRFIPYFRRNLNPLISKAPKYILRVISLILWHMSS